MNAANPHDVAPGVDERQTARGVVRGTVFSFAATALQMTVGFVTTPFFIEHLGISAYGVYTLVLVFTVSGYFGYVDLGLQAAIVHRAAPHAAHGRWDELSRVAGTAGALIAGITLVVAAVFAACAQLLAYDVFNVRPGLQDELVVAFYVAAAVLALQAPALVCISVLQTVQRWDVVVAVRSTFALLAIGVAVLLVAEYANVLGLILPVVVAPVAAMVALVVATRRIVPRFAPWPWLATRDERRELVRFARVILVAQAGILVASNLDQVLIASFYSARALGIYGVAALLYYAVFAAYAITNSTVFAATSNLRAHGDAPRLRELLVRGTRYAGSLVLVAATVAALFGPPFIEAWVGARFREAGALLLIWLTHFALTAFTGISQSILPAAGRAGTAARISVGAALVNVAVTVALMIPFGVRGIVAGTAIAYALTGPLLVAAALRATGTGVRELVRRAVAPAYAAACVAAVVGGSYRLAVEPSGLAPVIAGGALATAAGVVAALALLAREERRTLLGALRRRLTAADAP